MRSANSYRSMFHKREIGFFLMLSVVFSCIIVALPSKGSTADSRSVQQILKAMSLEQKVAQLLMVGFNGSILSDPMRRFLKDIPCGGVILYRHNLYKGPEAIQRLCLQIQNLAQLSYPSVPLLIATDLEGGVVKRIGREYLDFPSARKMGEIKDPHKVEDICSSAGVKLRDLGINMNLAPVLEPCGPIMRSRVFSCSIDDVKTVGVHFIRGFHAGRVIATGKHFPGNVEKDHNNNLGRIPGNIAELEKGLFIPFRAAIDEGVGAIMTSHVYITDVDGKVPATLSPKVIDGILRGKLGFEGVVISDDLLVASKKGRVLASLCTVPESAVMAVMAGVDILMLSDAGHARRVHTKIMDALSSKLISEQRLDNSVRRILELKRRFQIL